MFASSIPNIKLFGEEYGVYCSIEGICRCMFGCGTCFPKWLLDEPFQQLTSTLKQNQRVAESWLVKLDISNILPGHDFFLILKWNESTWLF